LPVAHQSKQESATFSRGPTHHPGCFASSYRLPIADPDLALVGRLPRSVVGGCLRRGIERNSIGLSRPYKIPLLKTKSKDLHTQFQGRRNTAVTIALRYWSDQNENSRVCNYPDGSPRERQRVRRGRDLGGLDHPRCRIRSGHRFYRVHWTDRHCVH
jgi:hypothetical protein